MAPDKRLRPNLENVERQGVDNFVYALPVNSTGFDLELVVHTDLEPLKVVGILICERNGVIDP